MIEDLKAFCIIYLVILWVMLFSANSKSIQNGKRKLIIWNDISSTENSKFLNCYYVHSSFFQNINLYVLLTWVCSCMMFQYFCWSLTQWYFIFIFCPDLRDQSWSYKYFGAEHVCIVWISQKVFLMYKDSFSIPLLSSLKHISPYFIHNSMEGSCN